MHGMGRVISGAHGAENGPVRGRVRHPQQRPNRVSIAKKRPHQPPFPIVTAPGQPPLPVLAPGLTQPYVPQFFQVTVPSAFRHSPGAPRSRLPAATGAPTAPGQSPGIAAIHVLPRAACGMSVIRTKSTRIHDALATSSLSLPPLRTGAQRPRPVEGNASRGDSRPRPAIQRSSMRPPSRDAPGCPFARNLPVPLEPSLSVNRDHLAEHDRDARAIFSVPRWTARTGAPPPRSPAALIGDAPSAAAPLSSSPLKRALHTTGRGKKHAREAPSANRSSNPSLAGPHPSASAEPDQQASSQRNHTAHQDRTSPQPFRLKRPLALCFVGTCAVWPFLCRRALPSLRSYHCVFFSSFQASFRPTARRLCPALGRGTSI